MQQSVEQIPRRRALRIGSLMSALTGASIITTATAGRSDAVALENTQQMDFVPMSEKGAAAGVATLDLESKIPNAQLPDLSGTYARRREFYPEDYGADRSGATNAQRAIQAAIDAARDFGGGDVILDGTYRIDSSLVPRDNVILQGRGWGRSVIKPPSSWATSTSLIQTGGSAAKPIENFFVRDIKFDLSDVPATLEVKAIFVTYMRNLRFENNWVLNSTATGIGADFLDKSIIRGNRVEGCGRFAKGQEESKLGCSGIGIGTGAWGSEATVVDGNFIINPARYGIFVEFQGGISAFFTTGIKIVNNYIYGAYRGIGSDGVAWMHITGNSIESCRQDGISIRPGNAGGKSYGDLIAHNTVINSARHGLLIDMVQAGNGVPDDFGKFMIVNNRYLNNAGAGVKVVAPTPLPGVQFLGNRISGNGSIGLDLTAGGFTESDVFDNQITNNGGIGIRLLGTQGKVRIKNNRVGDTRSKGKSQTHGIEFSSSWTFTEFEVIGNDVTGNAVLGISIQGSLVNAIILNNIGLGPDPVEPLTVAPSLQNYRVGPRPEKFWVIGGSWTSIQLNGQTILTGPGTFDAEPNDLVTFNFTSAPVAIKRRRL